MVKRMNLNGEVFTFRQDGTWTGPGVMAEVLTDTTTILKEDMSAVPDKRNALFYEIVESVGGEVEVDDEVLDYAGENSPDVNY